MSRLLRAAFVIARRDYVATVWSRTFLLFLIGPMLPVIFGGLFGAVTAQEDAPRTRAVRIAMAPPDIHALLAARAGIARRLGEGAIPRLSAEPDGSGQAVLSGTLAHPVLAAPADAAADMADRLAMVVDMAQAVHAAGTRLPPPVTIAVHATTSEAADGKDRVDLARGAQFVLFFLTMLLAGMTISNLVEEKSSKVIESLAAAVPVDAIFLGKLVGMLAVSLTGVAFWTLAGVLGSSLLPPDFVPPAPAVGWPVFLGLGILYFATVYLLIGAVYLGIGAQAGSVREVQTVSMPLTMGQLLIFGLATATARAPASPLALIAAVIPWTSPFAMIGRAALLPALWPHMLALVWQIAALLLTIRVAARLFRRNVMKSGRASSLQP